MASKLTAAQIKALEIVSQYAPIHESSFHFRIGRGGNLWRSLDVLARRNLVTYADGFYTITPAGRGGIGQPEPVQAPASETCECGNYPKLAGYRVCESCKSQL